MAEQDAWVVRSWHRLTDPHEAVTGLTKRRRARLAAGLLLVLVPLATVFGGIYAHPVLLGRGTLQDLLSIGVLVAFLVAYAFVRGPRFQWGILLLILAPLVAILASFGTDAERAPLLYFTMVPVLLGGLLLDLRMAAALAILNLGGAGLLVLITQPLQGPHDLLDPFLFLLATSPTVLLGAGFLERSIRDAEEANERLRVADAYRLRLLNTIVHDLSTPLTPLNLQLAMLEAKPDKHTYVMRRNVDLLCRLINDIADLAKIESDHLKIQPQPADLGSIAHEAADALRDQAHGRNVTIEVEAPEVPVRVDADRMTQVFYNLLSNAIKFTPQGGQIHVRVQPHDTLAEVSVRDTGRGLEPVEIERLFQPFSQVHDRAEVKERGTGLGLFITKAIVEAHGGSVWAQSDGRGRGSTFGFAIPAGRTTQA